VLAVSFYVQENITKSTFLAEYACGLGGGSGGTRMCGVHVDVVVIYGVYEVFYSVCFLSFNRVFYRWQT
jgi:hypothetical protein